MKLSNTLRHHARIFFKGGPVGLIYAVRLAWVRRRLDLVTRMREGEKALHKEHMQELDHQVRALASKQSELHIAAANYWQLCEAAPAPVTGAQQ